MESYQGSVWHLEVSCAHEWRTWAEEETKWQPRPRGASVPSLSMGLGAHVPSLPVTGWVLPQGTGEFEQDMCNPQGNLKQKQSKKRNFPSCALHQKGIHSEKQGVFWKWRFLGLWEGTSQSILRSNDKRVLRLGRLVGSRDSNHEKGNDNHWKIPRNRLCWDRGENGTDFF